MHLILITSRLRSRDEGRMRIFLLGFPNRFGILALAVLYCPHCRVPLLACVINVSTVMLVMILICGY